MKKIILFFLIFIACDAYSQSLRFSNHREPEIPDYAVIRIGPFYSLLTFSQSFGYRYTRTSGPGTEYLYDNERGRIKEDGSEIPLITSLRMRNYFLISRYADLDFSIELVYEHYPLGTQDDVFALRLPDEGIYANLSTSVELTRYVRMTLYENASYETDYIDTRGYIDQYGGSEYEHFENNLGIRSDWKMSPDQNLGLDLSRTDVIPFDDEFENQERVSYEETLLYEYELFMGLILGAKAAFSQNYYADDERDDTFLQDFSFFARGSRGAGIPITEMTRFYVSVGYSYAADSSDSIATDDQISAVSARAQIETLLTRELKHSLSYSRGIKSGFESDFEEYDSLRYDLGWNHLGKTLAFFAEHGRFDAVDEVVNSHTDTIFGINAAYPLYVYMTLFADTSYQIRDNEDISDVADVDEEWLNDYNTWASRIGTRLKIYTNLDFELYAQHVERTSDSDFLTYDRDIFAGTFTFTHNF